MKRYALLPLLACIFFAACNPGTPTGRQASSIYYNGDILTMAGPQPAYAEALAVKDGKILYAGSKAQAMKLAGDATQKIDLAGQTLMPGFIDAHGHVGGYASFSFAADLQPQPYGKVMSIPDLQQELRHYIRDKKIPDGTLIIGNGYDDAVMQEHRHPTAAELDAVSTTHPIYIMHTSGHMGVANSKALQTLGITDQTPDPIGGMYGRDPVTHHLTGKMIENAHIHALMELIKLMPVPANPTDAQKFGPLENAVNVWLANGQTTICDGRTAPGEINLIKEANAKGLLKADIIILPDYDSNKDSLNALKKYYNHYDGHIKIGAIKMTFDGSPQGKSAWLTQPYLVPPDGEKAGFKGHPIYTHQAAYNGLKDIFQHGMQAHIHCNGDAAIDEGLQLLDTLQQQGLRTKDMRCVLIHAQVCRPDQVPLFKKLNVMPSWFPTHCYLWGDWHLTNVLGDPRASHISPLKQGLDNGIVFTIHHDSPVTPPDLLTAVYAAVNRVTRSGKVLGPDQRISAYEALKAITINAAYQWGEEKDKGSLEQGKRADLVILDQNPLKVDPLKIKDIHVITTIKDGVTVYQR